MAVVGQGLEKELLVGLLKNKLNWSESILTSLNEDSLKSIYTKVLNKQKIYKAKVTEMSRFEINFYIPVEVRKNYLTDTYNFNIKYNLDKKEVYLCFDKNGRYHVKSDGKINNLPFSLVEKGVLKQADDAMLYYKDGRITVKSFTFMQ